MATENWSGRTHHVILQDFYSAVFLFSLANVLSARVNHELARDAATVPPLGFRAKARRAHVGTTTTKKKETCASSKCIGSTAHRAALLGSVAAGPRDTVVSPPSDGTVTGRSEHGCPGSTQASSPSSPFNSSTVQLPEVFTSTETVTMADHVTGVRPRDYTNGSRFP